MLPSKPLGTPRHPRVTIEDENGIVRLDDLLLQITNPILPPMSMQTVARVAAAAITTAYVPFLTVFYPVSILQVFNSLGSASDVTIGVQYAGSGPIVDKWRLEGDGFTLDLASGRRLLPPSTVFYVKYTTQPASGSLRVVLL